MAGVPRGPRSFSPPKGIRCFSTEMGQWTFQPLRLVSVPRRGFVVFLPGTKAREDAVQRKVSVPRRGFVVFLPGQAKIGHLSFTSFSPPKGIRCFSTQAQVKAEQHARWVSVPRRGFVVFLPCLDLYGDRYRTRKSFSPPKGIRCFSTRFLPAGAARCARGFSPPKGIRCFSTRDVPFPST